MTAPTVKGRTRFITLADLDGRTRAARNARDIAAAMTADLGGEQDLTEAQRQLIQRAATLGALIEDFRPALSRAVVSVARYDNGGTMLSWIRPAAATML